MIYIFMGPSCSGKSSAAKELKKFINLQLYTGKDYLRMSKNEDNAWKIFYKKLQDASNDININSQSIVYIISDKEYLQKLNLINNAITVKFKASSDVIKSRFAQRMKGNIPKPVEKMIENQIIDWHDVNAELCIDTSSEYSSKIAEKIYEFSIKF